MLNAYNSFENKTFARLAQAAAGKIAYYNRYYDQLIRTNENAVEKGDEETRVESWSEIQSLADFLDGYFKGFAYSVSVGIDKKFGKFLEAVLPDLFSEFEDIPKEVIDACSEDNLLERPDYMPPEDPVELYALMLLAKY